MDKKLADSIQKLQAAEAEFKAYTFDYSHRVYTDFFDKLDAAIAYVAVKAEAGTLSRDDKALQHHLEVLGGDVMIESGQLHVDAANIENMEVSKHHMVNLLSQIYGSMQQIHEHVISIIDPQRIPTPTEWRSGVRNRKKTETPTRS